MPQRMGRDLNIHSRHAKAKRKFLSKKTNNKNRTDSLVSLNANLLNFITETLENDKSFDFRETGIMYTDAVAILEGKYKNSKLIDSDRLKEFKTEFECSIKTPTDYYIKDYENNNRYTDCYIALSSIFATNPLTRRRNSLTTLLEQDFLFPEEETKTNYVYINVKDVIKSKGNSVFGPKREDIALYNKKIYQSFTKEVQTNCIYKPVYNFDFLDFPQLSEIKDKILFADYVYWSVFDGSEKRYYGNSFMIIHQNYKNAVISVLYNKHIFLRDEPIDSFRSFFFKNKKKIVSFFIEKFTLYEFEFICEQAAKDAFEIFFKDSAPVSPPPICDLEEFSNFF